jgi:hypothetical protein
MFCLAPCLQLIACPKEETSGWLHQIGQVAKIIGTSVFTVPFSSAREENLKFSSFLSSKIDTKLALRSFF